MSQSNQIRTTPALSFWQRLLHYLLGLLVGAIPLLFFGGMIMIIFNVLQPLGLQEPALLSIYSWIPWISALLWIGDLVLGIVRVKKNLAFSLGIFSALVVLLLISPGVYLAWALGSDGLAFH